MVKLKAFDKFENTTDALNAASHLVDSKLPKGLRKFLKAQCQGETLVIADSKLGKAIQDKLVSPSHCACSLSTPGQMFPSISSISRHTPRIQGLGFRVLVDLRLLCYGYLIACSNMDCYCRRSTA